MLITELKNKVNFLRERSLRSLSTALEYSADWSADNDDYSREYAFNELLYHFQAYKRALSNFPELVDETVSIVEKSIIELLSDLNELDFLEKYDNFLQEYFSTTRYSKILNKINTKAELVDSSSIKDLEEKVADYFSIIDKFNLYENNLEYFQKIDEQNIISNFYNNVKIELLNIFNHNNELWVAFSEIIANERSLLLVPNNQINSYWFEFEPLTALQVDTIFSKYCMYKTQNSLLFNLVNVDNVNELFTKIDGRIDDYLTSIIGDLRSISENFDNFLINTFTQSKLQPVFATYSKNKKIKNNDLEVLKDEISAQTELMNELMEKIEDLEDSEERRKDLLRLMYCLFQDNDKANRVK
jgi:flagellar motility protein MotE (MotC chaperone)